MGLEPWPCDISDDKCSDIGDLEQHKRSYHRQLNQYYIEEVWFSWWPEEPYLELAQRNTAYLRTYCKDLLKDK